MFRQPGGARRRLQWIIATFQQKGATSPEKAMTAQELGLPPMFEEAMERRLGQTGIFLKSGEKYYLDESRLQQFQRRGGGNRPGHGSWQASRGRMLTLRIARMMVGLTAVVLAVSNFLFARSALISVAVLALILVWIALTVFQLYYLSIARRQWRAAGLAGSNAPGT